MKYVDECLWDEHFLDEIMRIVLIICLLINNYNNDIYIQIYRKNII
jgi:hypothetical protein